MMMSKTAARKLVCLVGWLLATSVAAGQVTNLAAFDKHKIHLGIQIGYAQSKFDLHYTEDEEVREFLQGTTSYYSPGFRIAFIVDLRLNNYLSVRTLPGITFFNRNLYYSWESGYSATQRGLDPYRQVESVYGEIPFDIKFRALRWRNFRTYLTSGMSYGFDFASFRNNKNNDEQSIVKLNTSDFRFTAGAGFDFFLRYVKFAIELKFSFGLRDLLIPDNDIYSRSVDNLNSRSFLVGFTFET